MARKKSYKTKLKDPRWQKRRLEILKRDDFRCLLCGSRDKTLHVHHRMYFGDPWEAPDWALETHCEECHDPDCKGTGITIKEIQRRKLIKEQLVQIEANGR